MVYYMRDMKRFEGKKSSGGQTKKEEQSNEKKYQKQYEYLKEIKKNIAIKLAMSSFHLLLCILTVTCAQIFIQKSSLYLMNRYQNHSI